MYHFCLLAMLYSGDVAEPTLPKGPLATHSSYYVRVIVDAGPTNSRGLQIVTVRLTLSPSQRQDQPSSISPRALTLKLTASTSDARTRIDVIYPKGHREGEYTSYERDEVAIQVLIQRTEADRSPVQGRIDFGVMGTLF